MILFQYQHMYEGLFNLLIWSNKKDERKGKN